MVDVSQLLSADAVIGSPMGGWNLSRELDRRYIEVMDDLTARERSDLVRSLETTSVGHGSVSWPRVGDAVPDFSLTSPEGAAVQLGERLSAGPVVISFFRGVWCRFCDLELQALQRAWPQMQAMGASLLAICPELPGRIAKARRDLGLEYEVLSDGENRVARLFGLVVSVPPVLRQHYEAWGIDLNAFNGDSTYELPIPATYVVDQQGRTVAVHACEDYTKRMEPSAIVQVLQHIRVGEQSCSPNAARLGNRWERR